MKINDGRLSQLQEVVVSESVADNWFMARNEWFLSHMSYSREEENSCICGKTPIVRLCHIKNSRNGNLLTVGSHCVSHFDCTEIDVDDLFSQYKKITTDKNSSPSSKIIEFVHKQKIINDWEAKFLRNNYGSRYLSHRQAETRRNINLKIEKAFTKGIRVK